MNSPPPFAPDSLTSANTLGKTFRRFERATPSNAFYTGSVRVISGILSF